jgi:hypothetical protein
MQYRLSLTLSVIDNTNANNAAIVYCAIHTLTGNGALTLTPNLTLTTHRGSMWVPVYRLVPMYAAPLLLPAMTSRGLQQEPEHPGQCWESPARQETVVLAGAYLPVSGKNDETIDKVGAVRNMK